MWRTELDFDPDPVPWHRQAIASVSQFPHLHNEDSNAKALSECYQREDGFRPWPCELRLWRLLCVLPGQSPWSGPREVGLGVSQNLGTTVVPKASEWTEPLSLSPQPGTPGLSALSCWETEFFLL